MCVVACGGELCIRRCRCIGGSLGLLMKSEGSGFSCFI